MRFDSLAAWLDWQESCHPREIELGLDRIREVARRLDLLQPAATVITVAGTNGKGSCVATLEAMLVAQKLSVGAYSSPHLLRYNERVRVAGDPVSDQDLCSAFAAIDDARGDITLTYFEFGTLAAFWLFRRARVDYWLLEVGLGGRLDATNLIDADLAIVTSIALDHQQWLGNDRETIGREKAGIFRRHRPVVCADHQVPESVLAHGATLECPVYLAGREFDWQVRDDSEEWTLLLNQANKPLQLPLPKLPMPSVAAALQALALIDRMPSAQVAAEQLAKLQLPGRFQQLNCSGKTLYLDVAHNPAAAEYLARHLEKRRIGDLAIIVAMMADKDIAASLQPLRPFVRHWWLATLPGMPRAAAPSVLREALIDLGVGAEQMTLCSSVEETVKWLLEEAPDNHRFAYDCESLLVTGSFYTVSAALRVCDE